MDIKYLTQFNSIDAGLTLKPDSADERRNAMIGNHKLIVRAKLIHGTDICIIDKSALKEGSYLEVDDCDGLVTDLKDVMLTSTHGDCIPVYAYDPVNGVIGIAHSGWKGTANCIVSALLCWMKEEYKCKPKNIHVTIGAGIGACCFEVDVDVVDYFTEGMPWTEEYIYKRYDGKYMIDLKGIICELAEIEGVKTENITIDNSCTCCKENRDKFWTYRGAKDTKRMLAYIAIK